DPSQLIKNKAAFQLQIDESALKSQDFVELNGRLYKIYKSMQKTKNCFINRNEPLSIFCLCDITEYKLVNDTYRQESKLKPDFEFDLVASGVIMQKVVHLIKKIAPSNATVLLTGESGTGKSHLACLIHKLSDRADKPFLTVNCGSIPADLLESELFGSVKGAFTGAVDRKGLFLEANSGTVFLDEIGELPPNLQVKLLRVIQDKKVKPLGKNIEIDVDVRLICATNRNLEIAVQNGDFREDLYYRINVVKIVIPPLRDRKEEIPEFIRKFLERKGLSHMKFEPAAIDILMNYDYPGNIRELENILERALIMAEGNLVRKEAIQFNTQVAKPVSIIECDYALPVDLDRLISSLEGTLVRKALKTANFDKNQAAKLLNISTRSLRYRAQKYNLN
ncbi:MAG: sigma 54-interacting transcriptional regulator, partial [Deltaproteobacteria bacterium]|nr:sigma 54-interacting transcriptional regulator [Deltaproteobacteria bacterium]